MVRPAVDAYVQSLPEDVQKSAYAALAQSLANSIDNCGAETAIAPLTKTLMELLDKLRELAPREEQEDELNAIRKRLTGRTAA